MSNNDIIKALECCTGFSEGDCTICPLCNKEYCREALMGYGRNLINHLQAENEELKNEIVIANKLLEDYHTTVEELGRINESVRSIAGATFMGGKEI